MISSHVAYLGPRRLCPDRRIGRKTGIMDGEALDQNKIKFLATLPGKDQLRAQFLCLLKEPSARLARVLNVYATKDAPAADAATAPQA